MRAEGVLYRMDADADAPVGFTPGQPYATVQSSVDCVDVRVDGSPVDDALEDGESTFLSAGTDLHPVEGSTPAERPVAWWESAEGWIVLVPMR